jgi:hypothetical protein
MIEGLGFAEAANERPRAASLEAVVLRDLL